MNANELKVSARTMTVNALATFLKENDAVQFDDASFAVLQVIDGQEVWTEVSVKSKAFKPTKVSPAFDPYVAAEDWKEEKRIKAEEKAEKEKEKARKAAERKEKEEA